jgi:hypothetical protein
MYPILNIMPLILSIKIMVYISAGFSILYFILSLIELGHIFYNRFRANYDWQSHHDKYRDNYQDPLGHLHEPPSLYLLSWTIIFIIVTILLIIVFPINNI